jgi:hypothetical protein
MLVERACVLAGNNQLITQHRDTLRYAKLRSGGYLPKLRKFDVGDYVYTQYRTSPDSLTPQARPEVLRIVRKKPSQGVHPTVLVLQGLDGKQWRST